jgi:hypothetical protein
MSLNRIWSRLAAALPLVAIALALANWYAAPARVWAWTAVIVIAVVMVAVQRFSQRTSNRTPGDAASTRSADSITSGVVFAALMMIVPLALTLAHTYGYGDKPGGGMLRTISIVAGAYLALIGNAMPRMLPPTSSMPCSGARVQAFQRRAGWTWTLCGLALAVTGLALPIGAQTPMTFALVATAMTVTIAQLVRLRKPQPHAQHLN